MESTNPIITIRFPLFAKLFNEHKLMMRIEFLQFLSFDEILKCSLLSKSLNQAIDLYRGKPTGIKNSYLEQIVAKQALSEIGRLKSDDFVTEYRAMFKDPENYLVLQDLANVSFFVHFEQSETEDGQQYQRKTREHKGVEYMASWDKNCGAHVMNKSYFQFKEFQNSVLHRKSCSLKTVCWFTIANTVQNIKIDREFSIYDIYFYHGCFNNIRWRTESATVTIKVKTKSQQDWTEIQLADKQFLSVDRRTKLNSSCGSLVKNHMRRVQLSDFFKTLEPNEEEFDLNVYIRETETGWKNEYAIEAVSVVNAYVSENDETNQSIVKLYDVTQGKEPVTIKR